MWAHVLYLIVCLLVQADGSLQSAVLTTPNVKRVDDLFQRLVDAVSRGEFPEQGQSLLCKLSGSLSSCFSESVVSSLGRRELQWYAPNLPQCLIQVSVILNLCRILNKLLKNLLFRNRTIHVNILTF